MRIHLTPVRMAISKKSTNNKLLGRMWRRGNSCTLSVGMWAGIATMEKSMEVPQKTKNRYHMIQQLSLWVYIWKRKKKMLIWKDTCTPQQYWGFPGGAGGKEPACQCQGRRRKRHRFNPWVGKIPWRRKWEPIPVFLLGKSHGQRSLAGYSPWGCRVRHDWNDLACTAVLFTIAKIWKQFILVAY